MAQTPVEGTWMGTLSGGGGKLRVQLHVKSDGGKLSCAMDSLDQGAMGLPCDSARLEGKKLSFAVPSVKGSWTGTLAENGNELDGTWTQGRDMTLNFTRQQGEIAPVPLADLKAVLDRDLAGVLTDDGGVAIGVLQHGARKVFTYGPVKDDSIFEIGSVTKTFTALMLAQMVEQKKVTLDEPVRDLLPAGTVAKPEGAEITLLDLATQHSGLPRLPDNLNPSSMSDPYANYHPEQLYRYLAKHGVAKPANAQFNYSNLGVGLLGQALAERAHTTYPELLKELVTGPLKLAATTVELSPGQRKRFAEGHNAQHEPVKPWTLDALAGAGAIRSTAGDMLTYLEAQLHPERAPETLASAIELCHQLRADVGPNMKIGLNWLFQTGSGNFWHNGATGGYSSYAVFNPKEDFAVIVLFNTTIGPSGSFADTLGQHIAQRLSGQPAVALH
ncbi:MAG TPA: serine hydrolase domain-containing protein [Bryobacteraceae bacterium]|nr:serine hydrolase domain-containing protein [Bryobacteraceae bacterium]